MAPRKDPATDTGSESETVTVTSYRGTGVTMVMIVLSVLAVILIVFLAQNTDSVPIEFLVWDGEAPLFVVVLGSVAAAAFLTLGVSGVWRRRRRRQRTEHEELQRLRKES